MTRSDALLSSLWEIGLYFASIIARRLASLLLLLLSWGLGFLGPIRSRSVWVPWRITFVFHQRPVFIMFFMWHSLKKYTGDPPAAVVPLPSILHGRVLPTPAAIVRSRLNRGRWQLLVHWEGRTAVDATWEDIDDFKDRYPAFQLADELFVGEEGSVVDAFVGRQYRRGPRPNRG